VQCLDESSEHVQLMTSIAWLPDGSMRTAGCRLQAAA
jgi:hypothetical protein